MKAIIIAVFLTVIFNIAFSDDDQCKNDLRTFITCAKDGFPESERNAMKDDIKSQTLVCFKNAGCDAPAEESSGTRPQHSRADMDKIMSPKVQECMKKKILDKFSEKFRPCLEKKGVTNVNFSALASEAQVAMGASADANADEHGAQMGIAIKSQYKNVKAVDKCCGDKFGGDPSKMKTLEQCLHDAKSSQRTRICKNLKPCITKISADCRTKGETKFKALCECMKEEEKKIAGKLADLGKQSSVGIGDLINSVADQQDFQDIGKILDDCYTETKEPKSPIMQMAIGLISKMGSSGGASSLGGTAGAGFSVSGRQCTIMSDMLMIDANDASTCEKCQ